MLVGEVHWEQKAMAWSDTEPGTLSPETLEYTRNWKARMKVYLVTKGEHSNYRVVGVFSSIDLARSYIAQNRAVKCFWDVVNPEWSEYNVDTLDVDDLVKGDKDGTTK
jgi:hypothetical protein